MKKSLPVFFATALLSGCVTVPVTTGCAVMGELRGGASCAKTAGPSPIVRLDPFELVDLLEAQEERECVPVADLPVCASNPAPGAKKVKLPKRGASIIRTSEDERKLKVAVEQMCRMLGNRCSFEKIKGVFFTP